MDEDDLLGHLLDYQGHKAHKLAFVGGVHVIEKYKNLSNKGFSREVLSLAPENRFI